MCISYMSGIKNSPPLLKDKMYVYLLTWVKKSSHIRNKPQTLRDMYLYLYVVAEL